MSKLIDLVKCHILNKHDFQYMGAKHATYDVFVLLKGCRRCPKYFGVSPEEAFEYLEHSINESFHVASKYNANVVLAGEEYCIR